jgi:hypothetical protein
MFSEIKRVKLYSVKRRLSTFFVLLMVIITIGCYPIYGVGYDCDKKSNFAQYRTYDWLPISPEAWMKSSDVKYVEEAVNTQFQYNYPLFPFTF